MAADPVCPPLLWPESLPCAGGLCDGTGNCICDSGRINVADFSGMFATACFDLGAVRALYVISAVGAFGVMMFCAMFILRVSRGREHKLGRVLLGGLGVIWSWLSMALGIVRAVRPEWVIGQHALPTLLFSLLFIVFWQFTFSVILRVVVLAKRVSLFALEDQKSQVLVRRSQWIYALYVFTVAINLMPTIMLAVPQSPAIVEGLGVCFFLGNTLVCFFTGIVALRTIMIPLCEIFKKHGSNPQLGINAESTNQLKRVVQKMGIFAIFIQCLTVGASVILFLPACWPIVLRSVVYLVPINNGSGAFVIIACISLFWPVRKGTLQSSGTGVTAVAGGINPGTGDE